MPVRVQIDTAAPAARTSPAGERSRPCLTLGLVNNMSAGAYRATDRHFVSLLEEASDGIDVCLWLYAMPGMPAGHRSTALLPGAGLDALVITGREPMTDSLPDEPWWPDFVSLLDWTRTHTLSAVWSCLAAHAAVLQLSGIERRRSARKHCGLFACTQVARHPITANLPLQWSIPHSRWNGLSEADLVTFGYRILARTADNEVDTFVRKERSLFVFFQGHPEYDADTLLREYRRDAGRYLRGESDTYPALPCNYFDSDTERALDEWRERAVVARGEALLVEIAAVLEAARIRNAWRATAVSMYRGWLQYLCARKYAVRFPRERAGAIYRPRLASPAGADGMR